MSTTHSIVGGVLGAGIAAGGVDIVNWPVLIQIAASWVISPVLGSIFAALFLYVIKLTVSYQEDIRAAAIRVVPILIFFMIWIFCTYLQLKGLNNIWKLSIGTASLTSLFLALIVFFVVKPVIVKSAQGFNQNREDINNLFNIPLIFSAALLSFAHGANDVANAVGPLAAINDAIFSGGASGKASVPFWVMLIGALGISGGLALYGPKLIRTVGSEITELNQIRAFCIAMSSAITVIVASQLGLPVSSTHIAVGAVFGVGFLREYLKNVDQRRIQEIKLHHQDSDPEVVEEFLKVFSVSSVEKKKQLLKELKQNTATAQLSKKERKSLKKVYRKQLVKRSFIYKFAAAWIITVPFSGFLAGVVFFTIRGMLLP